MNIGLGQITDALFNFFAMKKGPYLYLPDAALSFYNNWSHLQNLVPEQNASVKAEKTRNIYFSGYLIITFTDN